MSQTEITLADQIAPGLSGLEQLKAMIAAGGRPPMGETLAFSLTGAGDGWALFEGLPGRHAYNPIGTVHGGYAAALLDSACGCAVHSKLKSGQGYTTLELKVSYHRPLTDKTGPVRAEGRIVTFGRRAAFAEAILKDARGRIYATATSSLLVFER